MRTRVNDLRFEFAKICLEQGEPVPCNWMAILIAEGYDFSEKTKREKYGNKKEPAWQSPMG